MRFLFFFILVFQLSNPAFSQEEKMTYYASLNFNSFRKFDGGGTIHFEPNFVGGICYSKRISIGAGFGYNYVRSYSFEKVEELANLKYFNFDIELSYRMLRDHKISPVLNLKLGTGIPSNRNDSVMLIAGGNPYVFNYNVINWDNNFEGYFIRNQFQYSLSLLADVNISNHLVLELGGGYQYRLIKKTVTFNFMDEYIHQHGWTMNIGVKYVF